MDALLARCLRRNETPGTIDQRGSGDPAMIRRCSSVQRHCRRSTHSLTRSLALPTDGLVDWLADRRLPQVSSARAYVFNCLCARLYLSPLHAVRSSTCSCVHRQQGLWIAHTRTCVCANSMRATKVRRASWFGFCGPQARDSVGACRRHRCRTSVLRYLSRSLAVLLHACSRTRSVVVTERLARSFCPLSTNT